jgi:hypothetical protein
MAEAQGDADTMLGVANLRIRSLEQELAASKPWHLPATLRAKFLRLAVALEPENLSCDGELSPARVRAAHAEIMREWAKLETLAGRKVSPGKILDEAAKVLPASGPGHTPAPWFIQVTRAGEDTFHHHVMAHAADDGRHVEVCRVFPVSDDGQPGGESERNAMLIAAAPALLRSLTELLWQHDHNNGRLCGMALQDARAAVAGVPREGEGPTVQEEASDEGMKV